MDNSIIFNNVLEKAFRVWAPKTKTSLVVVDALMSSGRRNGGLNKRWFRRKSDQARGIGLNHDVTRKATRLEEPHFHARKVSWSRAKGLDKPFLVVMLIS